MPKIKPLKMPQRVEMQRERREIVTKTAADICVFLDLPPHSERMIAVEDILVNFFDKLNEKDKEIENYWKEIRA